MNKKIGDYNIIRPIYKGKKLYYEVICSKCSNKKIVYARSFNQLKNNCSYKNCGELFYKNTILNKVIGDYLINSYKRSGKKSILFTGICTICGRKKQFIFNQLKNNIGISHCFCSFLLKYRTKEEYKKFHTTWASIRTRTNNSNSKAYSSYGGRGITSEDFNLYIDFYDALYSKFIQAVDLYGLKNISIDRIDNNLGYTAQNCRFTTNKQQSQNRSNSHTYIIKQDKIIIASIENLKSFVDLLFNCNYETCLKSIEEKGFYSVNDNTKIFKLCIEEKSIMKKKN